MIELLAAATLSATMAAGVSPPLDIFGGEGQGHSFFCRMGIDQALGPAGVYFTAGMVPAESEGGVFGWGVDPVGLGLRRGRAYLEGRGGIRWFRDPIPVLKGERLNFTFDLEAGVRVKGWKLGVGFHHVSNAGRGERNPGVNYLMGVVGR